MHFECNHDLPAQNKPNATTTHNTYTTQTRTYFLFTRQSRRQRPKESKGARQRATSLCKRLEHALVACTSAAASCVFQKQQLIVRFLENGPVGHLLVVEAIVVVCAPVGEAGVGEERQRAKVTDCNHLVWQPRCSVHDRTPKRKNLLGLDRRWV